MQVFYFLGDVMNVVILVSLVIAVFVVARDLLRDACKQRGLCKG